jgi:hypothetical protein
MRSIRLQLIAPSGVETSGNSSTEQLVLIMVLEKHKAFMTALHLWQTPVGDVNSNSSKAERIYQVYRRKKNLNFFIIYFFSTLYENLFPTGDKISERTGLKTMPNKFGRQAYVNRQSQELLP